VFRVVVHRKATQELKRLKKAHLKKFGVLLETLKTDPIPWKRFDVKKIEGEENTYRIRIGDFRVIYFLDKPTKTVHILKVERRGKVYD